eukprot:c46768_g1_i1.p1 GENE.c46768_g1_i1~~c46768_g1_i1.p1  ORF type:complete len:176 (-),score=16.39 c46768_g1_i1:83-562(-)
MSGDRRVSFSAGDSHEEDAPPIDHKPINFGLVVMGRSYRTLCKVTVAPITCTQLEEEPQDDPEADMNDNPPISNDEENLSVVSWLGPLLLEIELTAKHTGNIVEMFSVGGTQFIIKARVMDVGMGTPLLRRGIRRRDSCDKSSRPSARWVRHDNEEEEE